MNAHDVEFWEIIDKMIDTYAIKIDRQKGSKHPQYSDYTYPLDYGYLDGTVSSDGDGIDVWVGSENKKRVVAIISSVDFIKGDSEIKILYDCSDPELELIYNDHNRSDDMKGILVKRVFK
jgi:inorganic pyrophosphatase